MLAPRYIPTDLQLVNFEHDLTKHQKKLEEIQKNNRNKKATEKEGVEKVKLVESREKVLKFYTSEKALAIEKDNELLLGRLVEISRKKKTNILSQSVQPKSLNGGYRQREKNRIAAENEAFAKRLLSQQAQLDRKRLENDYEKHQGLVKKIQRLDATSTRKLKLPPIKETKKTGEGKTEEEKEDIAEAEEKKEKEEKERKAKAEKEQKTKDETEQKQKTDKEAQEKKEKEEKEALEKKQTEEKEKQEREEKEKKEKEEAEQKQKEEQEKEKEAEEKKETPVVEEIEQTDTEKQKEEEGKSLKKLASKDGGSPVNGLQRTLTNK